MKRIILCLSLFAFFGSQAQQINPVPDYVFSNKMSVGRNAVTDTAAYFSIGPRYGAIRGMMPPMVTDTANMSATKRNGLLIFSIQKNKYLYWDSVGSKWAEMAGTAGSAITGSGVAGYMPEFTTSTNLDTTRLYHNAGRFAIGSTTTTNGVFNVYGGRAYFDTSVLVGTNVLFADEANGRVGIGNTSPVYKLDVTGDIRVGNGNYLYYITSAGGNGEMIGTVSTTNTVTINRLTSSATTQIWGSASGRNFEITGGGSSETIFLQNGTEAGRFNTARELLIGGSDVGAYALQVTGSIYNTTGAVFAASSGNVGIGTTSPQSKLEIGQSQDNIDGPKIRIANNGNTLSNGQLIGGIDFYDGDDSSPADAVGASIYSYTNDISGRYIGQDMRFYTGGSSERMRIKDDGEVLIGTTTDAGAYALQVAGAIYNTTTITTGAPTGGSIKPWRLGEAATVSPTSPNRTIRVEIDGTVYYIHAKTTND